MTNRNKLVEIGSNRIRIRWAEALLEILIEGYASVLTVSHTVDDNARTPLLWASNSPSHCVGDIVALSVWTSDGDALGFEGLGDVEVQVVRKEIGRSPVSVGTLVLRGVDLRMSYAEKVEALKPEFDKYAAPELDGLLVMQMLEG